MRATPTTHRHRLTIPVLAVLGVAAVVTGYLFGLDNATTQLPARYETLPQPVTQQVRAPLLLSASNTSVRAELGVDIVLFDVDPMEWAVVVMDDSIVRLAPAGSFDPYPTRSGLELLSVGDTEVRLHGDGGSIVFTVTVVPPGMVQVQGTVPPGLAESLVGLPLDEATTRIEQAGMQWRVLARDGVEYMATSDYSDRRVGLRVVDGHVAGAVTG